MASMKAATASMLAARSSIVSSAPTSASISRCRAGGSTRRIASQATSRTIVASRVTRRRSISERSAEGRPSVRKRSRRDSSAKRGKKLDGRLELLRWASFRWRSMAASRKSGSLATRFGESVSALISIVSPWRVREKRTVRISRPSSRRWLPRTRMVKVVWRAVSPGGRSCSKASLKSAFSMMDQ